jgi:ketosteroid isomerase-like protein
MSTANIALIQNLYGAFGRGDLKTLMGGMAADCCWEVVGRTQDHPLMGVRNGAAGVQEFFQTIPAIQDVSEFTPKEFFAADDRVFVLGHYAWTVRKTGKAVASDWIHVFTVRDGKVSAFREFTDTAKFADAFRD